MGKGLHFPKRIEVIKKLSRLEERLVFPRHHFQTFFTYKGSTGQYKSKGGIVNVSVNVDTTVSCLPRNLDSNNTFHISLSRKFSFKKDYIKGVIDRDLVWKATEFLNNTVLFIEHDIRIADRALWEHDNGYNCADDNLRNSDDNMKVNPVNCESNSFTRDNEEINLPTVEIESERVEEETLSGMEEDEAESERLTEERLSDVKEDEEQMEDLDDDEEDFPLNIMATDSLIENNISVRLAPGEGHIPLSLIREKDSDFLSFIKIYYGERLTGASNISYSALTKSLCRRIDRRAVNRVDYLLYMDRQSQLLKLYSNFNTVLRKRNKSNRDSFTRLDVSNEDYVASLLNKDQAYKIFDGVRSSPSYCRVKKVM